MADIITIASWRGPDMWDADDNPLPTHEYRAVRAVSDAGIRDIRNQMRVKGWQMSPSEFQEKRGLIVEGYYREIALLKDGAVVALFVYHPSWTTQKFQVILPQETHTKKKHPEYLDYGYMLALWHDVMGRDEEMPYVQSSGSKKPTKTVLMSDPLIYKMLGVELPWLEPHAKFVEWLSGREI